MMIGVIALVLLHPLAAGAEQAPVAKTVFRGRPVQRVSEQGTTRIVTPLLGDQAAASQCVVSQIGSDFYWASRENALLQLVETVEAFTFLAVDGSGYIKILKGLNKADLTGRPERPLEYVEHVSKGLGSDSFFGVSQSLSIAQGVAQPIVQATTPFEAERIAQFFLATLDSLVLAREAANALSTATKPFSNKDARLDALRALGAHNRAVAKLDEASRVLQPFEDSNIDMLAETARATTSVYTSLRTHLEEVIPFGYAEKLARVDSDWKALPIAAAGIKQLLIDHRRPAGDGKVGFLVISSADRGRLLSEIRRRFGDDVANGQVEGLHETEGSAGLLARFLLEPWRAADQ